MPCTDCSVLVVFRLAMYFRTDVRLLPSRPRHAPYFLTINFYAVVYTRRFPFSLGPPGAAQSKRDTKAPD
jgi:hypothetical protein